MSSTLEKREHTFHNVDRYRSGEQRCGTANKKALKYHQLITIMYVAKDHSITKRRIKVLKITGNTFRFMRHAKRTFLVQNVLAILPNIHQQRHVIS